MNDETELLFRELSNNGSIAIDFHPWAFFIGVVIVARTDQRDADVLWG